jgi:hypothetical protein
MHRECSAKHGLPVTRLELEVDMMIKNNLSLVENQNRSAPLSVSNQERDDAANDAAPKLTGSDDKQIISSKWFASTSSNNIPASFSHSMRTSLSQQHLNGPGETNAPLFFPSNTAMVTSLSCLEDCRCRCHLWSVIRSPRLLSNYLGNVVLGFSNLPWAASQLSKCDEQTCRRTASLGTEIKYFLPSWFSYAVANFKVDLATRFFPLNIQVRSLNTVPYDSPILVCTQEGDLEGIMRLLQSSAASLYDVDPYGLGLLYVSLCLFIFRTQLMSISTHPTIVGEVQEKKPQ